MSAPRRLDPCLETVARPTPAGGRRIRVVEVLATGTNGGAQEHLYGARHPDRPRRATTCRSCRCRRAAPSASSSAPGFDVLVIDEPDDAIAVGALAAHLAEVRPDVVHNHMYRAETRRRRGRPSPSARSATGGRTSCRPSTRAASAPRRTGEMLRDLTPHMDQLIAVSRAIERKIDDEGRDGDAGPPHLQRRRPVALRPPGAVLHAPRGVRHGAGLADRRRRRPARAREGPPDAARGVAARCCAPSPTRTC